MLKFSGKVALVTGGSSGIGLATACLLADQGAKVIVCARNERSIPTELDFVKCDVTREEDVKQMFEIIASRYGKLDFAFNNVGHVFDAPFLDTPIDACDALFDVNVRSTMQCMQEEIRLMLRNPTMADSESKGVIVNNIEIVGLHAGVASLYTASKHGLVGLTKTVSREFAPQGIRINGVCPGFINSGLTNSWVASGKSGSFFEDLSNFIPKRRIGTPKDVSKVVSFLFSTDSEYMHGSMVVCDGGFSSKSPAVSFYQPSPKL